MHGLIAIGIHILETLFFAGWVGSLLVIVLSAIEDVRTIFDHDTDNSGQAAPPSVEPRPGTL
jgi:hypothetical protein